MLPQAGLSRREREVMEIIHGRGQATAAEVREAMEEPPTDAVVRSILRTLVEKEHLAFEYDGHRYVYSPTVSDQVARRSALEQVVRTFFDDSTEGVMVVMKVTLLLVGVFGLFFL